MAIRLLSPQPTLVDQVYEALMAEITEGKFGPEGRLIQEELAEALGVSRQPVQQALMLLRSHGVLRDAPGRGLMVAPLDPEHVLHLYEIRGALDGLASAVAASAGRASTDEGAACIERGRAAVKSRSVARMIAADVEFHFFLYRMSGNPLIAEVCQPHWTYLRRVMGEVLASGDARDHIWDEHEAILEAVVAGNAAVAERRAREHVAQASAGLIARMAPRASAPPGAKSRRTAPLQTAPSSGRAVPLAKRSRT